MQRFLLSEDAFKMRRFFQSFFLMSVLLGGSSHVFAASAPKISTPVSSPAAQSTASLAPTVAWVGLHSFKTVNDVELWEQPAFKEKLEKALGAENYAMIQSEPWRVLGPQDAVMQKGDLLYFSVCKQHACMNDGAYIFMNLKKDTVSVCLHKQNATTRMADHFWLASDAAPKALDESACALYQSFDLYKNYSPE